MKMEVMGGNKRMKSDEKLSMIVFVFVFRWGKGAARGGRFKWKVEESPDF
jgi:hypothetical protein